MKNKRSKASVGIIFNISMILVFIFSSITIEPASVFAETPQEQPTPEGLEISQGEWLNYVIQEGESVQFPVDVKDPQVGEDYYWEITHPLPLGQASVSPLGDQTIVSYQALKGFEGEDVFGVQVSTSTGERARIHVVITVAQHVDERVVDSRQGDEHFKPHTPQFNENMNDDQYEPLLRRIDFFNDQLEIGEEFIVGTREIGNPYIRVFPLIDYVFAYGWTPDSELTLTIGDSVWTNFTTPWGDQGFEVFPFDIQPGDLVKMTDGVFEREHTVSSLEITEIVEDSDSIYGVAGPEREVVIYACGDGQCHSKTTLANYEGGWYADFSGMVDIRPGVSGWAVEYDNARLNSTHISWRIPRPSITVYPFDDYVLGVDWTPNSEITLRIGDMEWTEFSEPSGYVNFLDLYYDIQPGHEIWMTDGENIKSYVVSVLAITEFDEEHDVIYGIGGDNKQIQVSANNGGLGGNKSVETDENGIWFADFSDKVEIGPGTFGWLEEYDEEGNKTEIYWYIPDPIIIVNSSNFNIEGYLWPQHTLVTLTIGGQFYESQNTGKGSGVSFGTYTYDVQPGQEVVLSGGGYTRTHVIRYIAVTDFDEDNNIVIGAANPGSTLEVYAYDDGWAAGFRYVIADENGEWQADFSSEVSISTGTRGWVKAYDDEGNRTEIDWYVPDPFLVVNLTENSILSLDWPQNTLVTMTIDDQFIQSRNSSPWGDVWFTFKEFDLQPGQEVVLSGGGYTCTHVIRTIAVTDIDQENDIVSGIGDPGSVLQLYAQGVITSGWDEVTVDQYGNWQTNFSGEVDITDGSQGWVRGYDDERNYTHIYWFVPDPNISVSLTYNNISGYGWPANTPLTLTINSQFIQEQNTSIWGDVWFDLDGFDLQPGQEVMLSGGGYSRTYVIRNIAVTDIDQENNQVSGIGDPGGVIDVHAYDDVTGNYGFKSVVVDESGHWVADFSRQIDISKGTSGQVIQYDEEGNSTIIYWFVPDPNITVSLSYNSVAGNRWTSNVLVTLSIEGDVYDAKLTNKNGYVYFYLGEGVIEPGQEVVLSGGGDIRTHVVRNITVTEIDQPNRIVRGTADPLSAIGISADDGWVWVWQDVVADGEGNWEADFSSESNFSEGTYGYASQADEDGNITQLRWFIPDPYFQVILTGGYIFGYEWTPNSLVTLTVDGIGRGSGESNADGQVFIYSSTGFLPGQTVVLADGINTRTHIVKDIAVTEINQDNKTVSGTAEPSSEIEVSAHDGSNNKWLWISVDENGVWLANFAPYSVNITIGTYGWVSQYDDHRNSTNVRWYIPNPVMEVSLLGNSIFGREWGPLTNITLFIDGIEIAQQSSDNHGRVYLSSGLIDIIPGMEITLTDGTLSRTHIVRDISITDVDLQNDTISGTADQDSWVQVIASNSQVSAVLSVQANASGTWLADFSGKVDIKAGASGNVTQYDSQGNSTTTSWFVPDPYISVSLNMNSIYGRQWPPDTQITLSIGSYTWTATSNVYGNVFFKPDTVLIEAGQQITLTGGGYTQSHTVRYIVINNVDIDTDIVSGLAEQGSTIHIYACSSYYDCDMLTITVDGSSGEWVADFSSTVGISVGSFGEAWQTDDEGNSTFVGWEVSTLAITSADNTTFTAGQAGTFTITTTGYPYPEISIDGDLPAGVTFADQDNGTATLSGTPAIGSGGSYTITITASNGVTPQAEQTFTLTVNQAPVITSGLSKSFTVGTPGVFLVTTTGYPTPTIAYSGGLPSGITFEDTGNGIAVLYGTPAAGSGGTYSITITASNTVEPAAIQPFSITVAGFSSCEDVSTISQTECEALVSFYSTNGGENWRFKNNWLITSDPGNWYGVTVENGHVTGLDLTSNNLSGELDSQFFNLTELTHLTLTNNQLSGLISPDFGSLTNLVYLDLQANKFTGEIPAEIGELANLKELWLTKNGLKGPIPFAIADLSELEALGLGRNKLTGEIPAQFGNLVGLIDLFLNDNQLTGDIPASLTNLTGLDRLALDYNRLTVPAQPESLAEFLQIHNLGWHLTQAKVGTVDPSNDTFTSPDQKTEIIVEPDSYDDIAFTFIPQPEPTQSIGSFGFAGNSFQLTAMVGDVPISGQLDTPFIARIYYDPETLGTIPEDSLTLYYWDEDEGVDGEWRDVLDACSVGEYFYNYDENWFEVPICHLSEFSVLGQIAPVFTSNEAVTFTVGQEKTFTIEAPANPPPMISIIPGNLPGSISFIDKGDGTATLAGTPTAGSGGIYQLTISATNTVGSIEQVITITVREKPSITSGNSESVTEGQPVSFTVETMGLPQGSFTFAGTLPEGISITDQGNGTALLSGTPVRGSAGTFKFSITAVNEVGVSPVQTFTLEILPGEDEDNGYQIFLPLILK